MHNDYLCLERPRARPNLPTRHGTDLPSLTRLMTWPMYLLSLTFRINARKSPCSGLWHNIREVWSFINKDAARFCIGPPYGQMPHACPKSHRSCDTLPLSASNEGRKQRHEILSQARTCCSKLLPSELNKPYLDWLKSTEMWAYGLPSCSSQSERQRRRWLVSRWRFGLTLFAELLALPLSDGDWLHVLFILL